MRLVIVTVLILFSALYGSLHYYIGLRFLQSFSPYISLNLGLYWVAFALLALSPFVSRLVKRNTRRPALDRLASLCDYWLAILYYAVLLWGMVDMLHLVFGISAMPSLEVGVGVILSLVFILSYGALNAGTPRHTTYSITLNKHVEGLAGLSAVLVSDLHLGTTFNNGRLAEMVEHVNALRPDIIFFAGDIIDGDVSEFAKIEMPRILRRLTPRLGSFAVLGNHEHIGGRSADAVKHMTAAGITVLIDQYTKVNDQFYVVGRNDRSGRYMARSVAPRKELSAIMKDIDHTLPIILLDHQPAALHEPLANKVDLQLSGHTHNGQFFPNHLVTGQLFEIDWGHFTKETLQVIVSCGYGTWGPPIRTSGYSEIVKIQIVFNGH